MLAKRNNEKMLKFCGNSYKYEMRIIIAEVEQPPRRDYSTSRDLRNS